MMHGLGTHTFCETGAILRGAWYQNKKIKHFQIFFPTDNDGSGFTFHGTWDNNELVSNQEWKLTRHEFDFEQNVIVMALRKLMKKVFNSYLSYFFII